MFHVEHSGEISVTRHADFFLSRYQGPGGIRPEAIRRKAAFSAEVPRTLLLRHAAGAGPVSRRRLLGAIASSGENRSRWPAGRERALHRGPVASGGAGSRRRQRDDSGADLQGVRGDAAAHAESHALGAESPARGRAGIQGNRHVGPGAEVPRGVEGGRVRALSRGSSGRLPGGEDRSRVPVLRGRAVLRVPVADAGGEAAHGDAAAQQRDDDGRVLHARGLAGRE